jgi:tripartite ATP-independent transporter DctM subunit
VAATGLSPAELAQVLLPPLALILLVLGSIFFGIATPTEAGSLGAVGAMVLAALDRGLTRRTIAEVCDDTLRTTAMVLAILIGSTAFSLVFRGVGGDQLISDLLLNLPGGRVGFLVVSMAVIFLLGFFIDFFEIAFIVLPLLLPSARALLGPEALLWFGVVIATNLQTSFLTPPFGFALFYLRGVAPPDLTTRTIYRGAWPFIAVQLAVLLLVLLFPPLVTWLPSLMAAS